MNNIPTIQRSPLWAANPPLHDNGVGLNILNQINTQAIRVSEPRRYLENGELVTITDTYARIPIALLDQITALLEAS